MRGDLTWRNSERDSVEFVPNENGYFETDNDRIIPYHKSAVEQMMDMKGSLGVPQNPLVADGIDIMMEGFKGYDKFKEKQQAKQESNTPDYVITAFIGKGSEISYRCTDGKYSIAINEFGALSETTMLTNGYWKIYSVRRNSDNETFTVDEIVSMDACMPSDVKIKSFHLHEYSTGGVVQVGKQIAEFLTRKTILVTLEQYGIVGEFKLELSELKKKQNTVMVDMDAPIFSVRDVITLSNIQSWNKDKSLLEIAIEEAK